MTGARNVKGGLVLLSAGLAAGLVMSLYAFRPLVPVPEALARYDDLPRRLIRLAHIAAIMLPLINVVLGPWLGRLRLPEYVKQAASWLLLAGAASLPGALALEGIAPPLITLPLSALPALAFSFGVFLVSVGAFRTDFSTAIAKEAPHASCDRCGATDVRDHRSLLQDGAR